MKKKSYCIKIPKIYGEKALSLTKKAGLIDKSLKIQKFSQDYLFLPIVRIPSEVEHTILKNRLPEFELTSSSFDEKRQCELQLYPFLEQLIPSHLMRFLPRSMDIIGDIALIEIPPLLQDYKITIGKAILKTHKNVRTVFEKVGAINGVFRLRNLNFLVGEYKTGTICKEYGCHLHLDVAKAYFSPRLSFEHNRIANLVSTGERILDLFAGVGPFVVCIAKKHADVTIYAVDMNPEAIKLLNKNLKINNIAAKVIPIIGDARKIVDSRFTGQMDRVIMNLPEKAHEFVDIACKSLKPSGGVIHFYSFVRLPKTIDNLKNEFKILVENCGRKVENFNSKKVRATAPYEWQVVLDVKIC